MNIDKLLDLITKKEIELQSRLNEENDELNFFEKVTTENCFSNVSSLLSIKKQDVLTAYLSLSSKKLSYIEINELLTNICKSGSYDLYLMILLEITKNYESFDNNNKIQKFILKTLLGKENASSTYDIKTLYDNNGEDLVLIFSLMDVLKDMEDDYDENKKLGELIDITMSDRKIDSVIYNYLQEKYNIKNMMSELSKISSHYQKLNNEEKNKKKIIRTKLNNCFELKKMLNNIKINRNSNINIEKVISLMPDDDIKREFLYQLNINQINTFDNLYKEYCKLSDDNKLEIQVIFEKYNYDFNSLSLITKDKVMEMAKDSLNELLLQVKELGIENSNLDFVIQNSDYDVLKNIQLFIKEGILSNEFVVNNLNILSISNYSILVEILEFIKDKNINPRLFITDQYIYLSDIDIIKNNINVLEGYNLLTSLKTTETFNFLKDDNLISKIDMLLELGYEKELENNIDLLNRNIFAIKKLYILKQMNLLPTDIETLLMVLDNSSFIDNNNNIDDYIFNIVDYKLDNSKLNSLEKVILNEGNNLLSRVIIINDVKLSRNRVSRNQEIFKNSDLDETDKLIYSYIYGSILTEEEYDSIVNYVKGEVKIK